MNLKQLLLLALLAMPAVSFAQPVLVNPCASNKLQRPPLASQRGTVADLREENYDVKYVKLDIKLDNQSTAISGNVLTHAATTTNITEYVFELTADLTIDSVKVAGALRPVTHPGNVGIIALAGAAPVGTLLTTQVYYHGTVPSGSAFFDRGLRNIFSTAALRKYTFTLGEPYTALDWWPCKQALQDKIDSSDVWITVPDTLKAGSNGLLQQVTAVSPNFSRYEWKSRSPIDYYLISASVGNYTDYSYYMHFNGSTDSMLMQNYIYPNTLAIRKPILDSTALMVNYFSDIFGRYPFWKEKYGHCQAPLSGGEEHQTMTTIGVWGNEVVPHELSHQWFGDHVTCGTWKDIWLNEGFASYAEYLYLQHFRGATVALGKIGEVHYNSMFENGQQPVLTTTGAVYVDDTTDEGRIFSSRLSYNKGSSIIHTLRFEANDDVLFFNTLKAYQTQFANGTATTEEFKALVAQQYGRNMDTFFNQWIYSSGWPVYHATWNQKNGIVLIQLAQQATGNYTAHKYSTPLEIKFTGPQGDTTIRVYTNDAATAFSFATGKTFTGVVIDPNDWLLDTPGVITKDNSLSITPVNPAEAPLYPNPVHNYLTVGHSLSGDLQIMDIYGKIMLSETFAPISVEHKVDMHNFAPGIYLYRIVREGAVVSQGKLIKD